MRVDFIFRGYRRMEKVIFKGKSIASNIKPDWEELCSTGSSMAKAVGWTKEDSRNLLKKVRNESRSNRAY